MKRATKYLIGTITYFIIFLLSLWASISLLLKGQWYLVIIFGPLTIIFLDKVFCGVRAKEAGHHTAKKWVIPFFLWRKKPKEQASSDISQE